MPIKNQSFQIITNIYQIPTDTQQYHHFKLSPLTLYKIDALLSSPKDMLHRQ